MPLYEYQCEKCGEKFEVMQKFADERLTTHEKCGGHLQRLISTSALLFKGSGFYINDYAKSGSGSESSAKKADSSEGKSSSSSETAAKSTPASTPSADSKPASSDSK